MTRKNKAYSFLELGTRAAHSGLNEIKDHEVTDELLIGAFSGTALAALTLLAVNKLISRKLVSDKLRLDETYSPLQRRWSVELEAMNKKLLILSTLGSTLGSIAGYQVAISLNNKNINEALGTTLGNRLGKSITDVILERRIKEYRSLLLEYEDSLTPRQKELRLELDTSLRRTGLIWTIGCIGGLVMGTTIGNSWNKNKVKVNK